MHKFINKNFRVLFFLALSGLSLSCFFSCQKASPSPYSNPKADVPHTVSTNTIVIHDTTIITKPDTTPSFKASVNNSAIISFTPGKSISGSNTTIKGVSSFYTITLTFPNTTGPGGPYEIGFGGPGLTATIVNGGTTYVVNNDWGGGTLTIDSISSKGKYYGKFNLDAMDSVSFNTITANQGSFYHL